MSLFKGKLDSAGMFTAQDDVRGLRIIAPGALPSYWSVECADGVDWYFWVNDSDNLIMDNDPPDSSYDTAGNIVTGAGNSGANRELSNLGTVAISESIQSDTDSTDDLGDASYYWANTYTDKLYLNSTAIIDGASAGVLAITGGMVSGSSDTGYDWRWYGDTATSWMEWDESDDALTFEDETFLIFGTGNDILIDWDGTDLNIDPAADDSIIRFGEAHDLDVIFESYASAGRDMGWVADSYTLQLTDDVILRLGGGAVDTMTDGVAMAFSSTNSELNIDAYTANDAIRIGRTTITDFYLDGASYDASWDGSASYFLFNDNAKIVFGATTDLAIYSDGAITQFVTGATVGGINIPAFASQTTAVVTIDGTTNGFSGADNVGMLSITNNIAMADAGATLLYLQSTATPIAAAEGFLARFVDTGARTASTWAVQMDSTDNAVLRLVTGSTTAGDQVITVVGGTSSIGSLVTIAGTGGWVGADNAGMLHLSDGSAHAHAGATLLYVGSTGTPIAAAQGVCARFEETGGRTSTAYAVEIDSLDNRCLNLVSGSTTAGDYVLNVTGGTSSIGGLVNITGKSNTWVGANNVGMLNLYCADASFAHAGATLLYVASSGQPITAAQGFLARFVDTGTARTNAYAVEIEVTSTTGALHCNGHATFDRGLQCGAVAITAATAASPAACPDGVSYFTVTSTHADHVVQLPTPTPGTLVWLQGSTAGYELRTSAPATVALNGGSRASAESAIPAGVIVRAVCTTATTWVATSWNSSGVEVVVEQAS